MKRIALTVLAAATVAAAIPAAASAQTSRGAVHYTQYRPSAPAIWQNINQRQRELDRRIDMGVRMGRISRSEAVRLRAEFRQIARLEQSYRRRGLTVRERADLDRRFDRLSVRIRWEANDRDTRRPGHRR
jgi:Ni/Co efflux regulator RcnB